jgi:outer membrane lipoprotein LolB
MRVAAVLMVLALLQGCAGTPVEPIQTRPAQAEQAPFAFNGRVATRHDDKTTSAGVRWTHRGVEDEILLLAPLGQTVARIKGDAQGVVLETDGKYYAAKDAETLTEQVLGWHLPMSGLRYWVLALPADHSEAVIERGAHGQFKVLRQDGWEIHYLRYATEAPDSLPLRLTLQRDGMEIKLFIDEWEMQ